MSVNESLASTSWSGNAPGRSGLDFSNIFCESHQHGPQRFGQSSRQGIWRSIGERDVLMVGPPERQLPFIHGVEEMELDPKDCTGRFAKVSVEFRDRAFQKMSRFDVVGTLQHQQKTSRMRQPILELLRNENTGGDEPFVVKIALVL